MKVNKIEIQSAGLLQCSRVQVIDVRPVTEQKPLLKQSILNYLEEITDRSSLLVVADCKLPGVVEAVYERNYFADIHKLSEGKHWIIVHKSNQSYTSLPDAPADTFVAPGGTVGQIMIVDRRNAPGPNVDRWIQDQYQAFSSGDHLVVHCRPSQESGLTQLVNPSSIEKVSIDHVRMEFPVE